MAVKNDLQGQVADDEAYNSSSDSDFDASPGASSSEASSSGDEAQTAATPRSRGRRKAPVRKTDEDGDLEMGSGDEGIIAQGKKKLKRKKGKKGKKKKGGHEEAADEQEEEDEADDVGVGIRVRLRSGRGGRAEEAKKKALPTASAATVDIDSIWARMNDPTASQVQPDAPTNDADAPGTAAATALNVSPSKSSQAQNGKTSSAPGELISIPHTYTFAGEVHTSTKLVPTNSPEAKAYLDSKAKAQGADGRIDGKVADQDAAGQMQGPILRRPLRRTNLLDPNPHRLIKGIAPPARTDLPLSLGGVVASAAATAATDALTANKENTPLILTKATKSSILAAAASKKRLPGSQAPVTLNTVEKSKLDWQAEVARHEGMQEELQAAEKSGTNYLSRMDFLDRVGEVREQEERRIRKAAAAKAAAGQKA